MFSFLLQLSSISAVAAALVHAPMPAPTAPAMRPRQDSDANGIVVMGYELIGTQEDEPVCKCIGMRTWFRDALI
jgi:hypothetical protein